MNRDTELEDRLFKQYEDELNGSAARRRSEAKARQEQLEREEEIRVWAERTGSPLPRDLEEQLRGTAKHEALGDYRPAGRYILLKQIVGGPLEGLWPGEGVYLTSEQATRLHTIIRPETA